VRITHTTGPAHRQPDHTPPRPTDHPGKTQRTHRHHHGQTPRAVTCALIILLALLATIGAITLVLHTVRASISTHTHPTASDTPAINTVPDRVVSDRVVTGGAVVAPITLASYSDPQPPPVAPITPTGPGWAWGSHHTYPDGYRPDWPEGSWNQPAIPEPDTGWPVVWNEQPRSLDRPRLIWPNTPHWPATGLEGRGPWPNDPNWPADPSLSDTDPIDYPATPARPAMPGRALLCPSAPGSTGHTHSVGVPITLSLVTPGAGTRPGHGLMILSCGPAAGHIQRGICAPGPYRHSHPDTDGWDSDDDSWNQPNPTRPTRHAGTTPVGLLGAGIGNLIDSSLESTLDAAAHQHDQVHHARHRCATPGEQDTPAPLEQQPTARWVCPPPTN
jgi:hypothetical protein